MAQFEEHAGGDALDASAAPTADDRDGSVPLADLAIDTASPEFRSGYEESHRRREIGKFFRAVRCALRFNQADLAARMGTSQPHIARIENGKSCPQLETFERLAAALESGLIVAVVAADAIDGALDHIDRAGGSALVYRPGRLSLEAG